MKYKGDDLYNMELSNNNIKRYLNKNKLIILTFLLLILPIVSATVLGSFKNGECVTLIQTCGNCSYANISTIIYPNSSIAFSNVEMTKDGTYYNYSFCDTSSNGVYIVAGFGDPDATVETWTYDFQITPNGQVASVGSAILYIGLLAVLLFFLGLSIYSFVTFENLLNRVGMFGLSYLLLIAITFIGWNMASDFLISSPFLIEMMRILFFVLIIGVFPLFIGAFAWYVIMLFKIKEIERMINKGIPYDEAEKRAGGKY